MHCCINSLTDFMSELEICICMLKIFFSVLLFEVGKDGQFKTG